MDSAPHQAADVHARHAAGSSVGRPLRLLFIKPKHIGDALLLTPTLTATRQAYPDAEIWVVVRRGTEGILAGCPAINRLFTTSNAEPSLSTWQRWGNEWRLIREIQRQRIDHAFELSDSDRGRWLARLSGARQLHVSVFGRPLSWFWRRQFSHISKQGWYNTHRVEKDYGVVREVLPLPVEIPPLAFEEERMHAPPGLVPSGAFAVMHPATRWQRKQWPEDRWEILGRSLLSVMPRLVISCGPLPAETAMARRLQAKLGENCQTTDGRLDWPELAWLLRRARLFVGVDTAAMHLAAACQTPTVAIFGPSNEHMWSPWRVQHRVVSDERFSVPGSDTLYFAKVEERLTRTVSTESVWAACDAMLKCGGQGSVQATTNQ